ncbi:hypothetical protein IWX65_001115 [Arthrobacter sp. CAN_A214]
MESPKNQPLAPTAPEAASLYVAGGSDPDFFLPPPGDRRSPAEVLQRLLAGRIHRGRQN